jgi:hypothetical protein
MEIQPRQARAVIVEPEGLVEEITAVVHTIRLRR